MKKCFFLFLFFLSVGCIHAQSADFITQLLATEQVTYGQACYFSAVSQGTISESASIQEAYNSIKARGLLYKIDCSPDDVIPMSQLSYLIVNIMEVKGGIMYSLFHNPRYALRLLESDGMIAQFTDPGKKINGYDFISLFIRCSEYYDSEAAQ